MAKRKTNDQKLRALVKEVNENMLLSVVMVERLLTISEATRKAISANPESFNNPIIGNSYFIHFCDVVDKHLK